MALLQIMYISVALWQTNGMCAQVARIQICCACGIWSLPQNSHFKMHNHSTSPHFVIWRVLFYHLFISIFEIMSFISCFVMLCQLKNIWENNYMLCKILRGMQGYLLKCFTERLAHTLKRFSTSDLYDRLKTSCHVWNIQNITSTETYVALFEIGIS